MTPLSKDPALQQQQQRQTVLPHVLPEHIGRPASTLMPGVYAVDFNEHTLGFGVLNSHAGYDVTVPNIHVLRLLFVAAASPEDAQDIRVRSSTHGITIHSTQLLVTLLQRTIIRSDTVSSSRYTLQNIASIASVWARDLPAIQAALDAEAAAMTAAWQAEHAPYSVQLDSRLSSAPEVAVAVKAAIRSVLIGQPLVDGLIDTTLTYAKRDEAQ